MNDNKTSNFQIPLPDAANKMRTEDLPRFIAAFNLIDTLLNERARTADVTAAINTAIANRPTTTQVSQSISDAINALIGGAPGTLDTLKELADAIADDQNFAATMATQLAQKANISALAALATSGQWSDILNKPSTFTPPVATASVLGGVKIGSGLSVDGAGVLSAPTELASGMLMPFAGSAAPSGWLLCAGQAVSRTTYAALFAAIGTAYGNGDSTTTFNLPDLRGRVPAGVDNMNGTAANRVTNGGSGITGTTLGASGGAETHTLTTAQMPSHSHTVNDSGHSHSLSNAAGPGGNAGTGGSGYGYPTSGTTASATTGISLQSAGSGGAHNNMQPTLMVNYIIKT